MVPGGENLTQSNSAMDGCRTVHELLQSDQYEQAIEALSSMQMAVRRSGSIVLVPILDAACQICSACRQCRDEADWHQQASASAKQREEELRQQLDTILELVDERGTEGTPRALEHPRSTSAEHLSLWRRMLNWIGRSSFTQFPTQEVAIESPVEKGDQEEQVAEKADSRAADGQVATFAVLEQRGSAACVAEPEVPAASADRDHAPAPIVEQGSPLLVVYCLGSFQVHSNGIFIERWRGHKCRSVFKYLVLHRNQPVHHEILMDLFWRETSPKAARRNLHQAIYQLRRTLRLGGSDPEYVLYEDSCYTLNPEIVIWVDSEAFVAHYQAGQRLDHEERMPEAIQAYEAADALYGGEFMAEDRYEDWPLVHREYLRHAHLDILDRLSLYYFDQARFATCIALCQKILTKDRCREDAHRRLMRCYVHQGQRHMALRQYHLCMEALKEELDVAPMSATVELYRYIQENGVQF
jgi:DNA-binding SARP family transcriptional activator